MEEMCILCGKNIEKSDKFTRVQNKGLKKLISCSLERNDNCFVNFTENMVVHKQCRKNYTRQTTIKKYLAQKYDVQQNIDEQCKISTRSTLPEFCFKSMCMFCGKTTDDKKIKDYSEVTTIEFKASLLDLCDERIGNVEAEELRKRIAYEHDLPAAEARYHRKCYQRFKNEEPKENIMRGRPINENLALAFEYLCKFMESNDDCQYTIHELQEKFCEYFKSDPEFYSDKQLLRKLQIKYQDRLVLSGKNGTPFIVCLKETSSNILLQQWNNSNYTSDEDAVIKVGSLIKEQVQNIVCNRDEYPNTEKMKTGGEEDIPSLLKLLIDSIITSKYRETSKSCKIKCIAICNAIMAATRPRSFISPPQIALGVYLYRAFGSKELIDILHTLGFCVSYAEVVRYITSATCCNCGGEISRGAFIHTAWDNADHNTRTLDGLNTLHWLGGIIFVTPCTCVSDEFIVPRPENLPQIKTVGKFGFIPWLDFNSTGKNALKKLEILEIQSLISTPPALSFYIATDLIWMSGQWLHKSAQTGWSGCMSVLLQNTTYEVTRVLPLPFVNLNPNDPKALYTAIIYSVQQSDKLGQHAYFFTFDLPLYNKAMEIIAQLRLKNEKYNKAKPLLGGFHLLMSFMGAVGYIMGGSGLKEMWEQAYAKSSVPQMLSGHHFSRALRAHFLSQHVLFLVAMSDSECSENENIKITFSRLHEKMISGELLNDNMEMEDTENLISVFREKILKIAETSRTAKLWLQYWDMVELIRLYVRAERTGNWELHVFCVLKMIPYFHASGHLNYARSAHLYLQDMSDLKNQLNHTEYLLFIKNFAVRRTDKFWAGLWTDQVIEQFLMRSMKTRGGLTRGRGFTDATVAKWIGSTAACVRVIEAMEVFTGFKHSASSEQHKELRESSKLRDYTDTNNMLEYMLPRSPFRPGLENLISIATGVCGDKNINCDEAEYIGMQAVAQIIGKNYCDVKLSRAMKVKNLDYVHSSISLRGEIVPIKPQQLLNRIGIAAQDEDQKQEALRYELALQPTSLSLNGDLRKNTKSKLLDSIIKNVKEIEFPIQTNFVVDGGYLLHCVYWPPKITYKKLYEQYYTYVNYHYSNCCIIVFDAYNDLSTKDHERMRRKKLSKQPVAPEFQFDDDMLVTTTRDAFLSNDKNKQTLILRLAQYLGERGVNVRHAVDDADYIIAATAVNMAHQQKNVTVVSQDTDVVIILCALAKSRHQINILQPGKVNRILKISSINKYFGNVKDNMLFCHAISGCDTTSAMYGKGKKRVMSILKQYKKLRKTITIFNSSTATKKDLVIAGEKLLLKLYNSPRHIKNISELRYKNYIDALRKPLSKLFEIETLPPTRSAAIQHIYRTYHQVQTWLGVSLPPTEWGWIEQDGTLKPNWGVETAAPDWVLNLTSCGCNTGCNSGRCSCRRAGLHCSTFCTNCHGTDCSNKEQLEDPDEVEELSYVAEMNSD